MAYGYLLFGGALFVVVVAFLVYLLGEGVGFFQSSAPSSRTQHDRTEGQ